VRNDKNILETRVVRGYTINVFTDPEPPKPDEYTDQPVYMYLSNEVLAFEVIDVNGRVIENLYGYYGSVEDVMKEAEACVPNYVTPPKEEWFVWREEVEPRDYHDAPNLIIPWSDPKEYEYAADGMFPDAESAEKWKEETAPDEEWWLCKVTTTPLELYRAKKEA
jgi:hypothetical protein